MSTAARVNPCSYPSEHNQFLLQCRTMRLLQPLTLPSIPTLFTSAAAGCATQMGLCSAMKWAWLVRVHVCCTYCVCMRFWHTAVAGEGDDHVWCIPVGYIWESPRDKLVWFHIPVCQTEVRFAFWLCQSLAMPLKDNKDNINAFASCRGFQFFFMPSVLAGEIRACFLLFFRRKCLMLFHAATVLP